jgi:hypothetical protein
MPPIFSIAKSHLGPRYGSFNDLLDDPLSMSWQVINTAPPGLHHHRKATTICQCYPNVIAMTAENSCGAGLKTYGDRPHHHTKKGQQRELETGDLRHGMSGPSRMFFVLHSLGDSVKMCLQGVYMLQPEIGHTSANVISHTPGYVTAKSHGNVDRSMFSCDFVIT